MIPVASAEQSPFWCVFTVNAGTGQAVHYVNDNLIQADDVSYREADAWMSYIRSSRYSCTHTSLSANR